MLYFLLTVVAFVVVYLIFSYNKVIKLRQMVKEAFSTMDVFLKKRFDLVPNLVETVKGYSLHEKETLETIVKARNQVMLARTAEEKIQGEDVLTSSLKSIFALTEAYPDLKANENFLALQTALENTETEIASARKYYNATVRHYNTALEVFPSNLVAKAFGFLPEPLFELADKGERLAQKVSF